jgi:hypothetical protein
LHLQSINPCFFGLGQDRPTWDQCICIQHAGQTSSNSFGSASSWFYRSIFTASSTCPGNAKCPRSNTTSITPNRSFKMLRQRQAASPGRNSSHEYGWRRGEAGTGTVWHRPHGTS